MTNLLCKLGFHNFKLRCEAVGEYGLGGQYDPPMKVYRCKRCPKEHIEYG